MKHVLITILLIGLHMAKAQYGDYSIKQLLDEKGYGTGINLATYGKDMLVNHIAKDLVYVYRLQNDSTWKYVQTLAPSDKKVGITKRWNFGYDLAMSADNAVIGAPDKGTINEDGAVYFFHKGSDGVWREEDIKNVPFDTLIDVDYYYGGQNIQMYGDKATVSQNNGSPNYVHIYQRNPNGKWSIADTLIDRISNISNNKAYYSDSIYVSGIYKYQHQIAKAYMLKPNGQWVRTDSLDLGNTGKNTYFGDAIDLEGNTMIIGAKATEISSTTGNVVEAGMAYVYEKVAGKWQLAQSIKQDTIGEYYYFGGSVAIQNGLIVISSSGSKNKSGIRTGAVHLYRKKSGVWTKIQSLSPTTGDFQAFGGELFINKNQILVGSNLGVYVLQGLLDCNGDKYGTAVTNSCGICVEGETGLDSLESEQNCITGIYETSTPNNALASPNPFEENLQLDIPAQATASLLDIQGQEIMTNLKSGGVPTAHLPKGCYILRVSTADKVSTLRLVK